MATAVLPQPSATATTPPTALPSATIGVETAVVTSTNTPVPISTSTFSGTENVNKLPVILIDTSVAYSLQKPSPAHIEDFLELLVTKFDWFDQQNKLVQLIQ